MLKLTARRKADVELIEALPEMIPFGTVLIDDFHRLSEDTKAALADLLKILADNEELDSKLIIIGINQAGQSLISSSPDLSNRIDVVRFEVEPDSKVSELISKGEAALNVDIRLKDSIISEARGSFYLAQILCHEACVQASVIESQFDCTEISTPYSSVKRRVIDRQADKFGATVRNFARGTKFRPGGRAPYLHILKWLAEADQWSLSLREEVKKRPKEKASVLMVLQQGFLQRLTEDADISNLLHFNPENGILSVEDPLLVFYLRNLNWADFVRDVGFTNVNYDHEYDVALSFAGEDRKFVEHLRDEIQDKGLVVFYDFTEMYRIVANNIEEYMRPIYDSGSRYVVVVIGESYSKKRWTIFEANEYMHRIKQGAVIPVISRNVELGATDQLRDIAHLDFDPDGDLAAQAKEIAEVVAKKIDDM
ncbi:putative protein containing a TIR (Toll-Interleukin 1-resistance) domain protein [Actinokineospora sp. UTMC 2448]|nr:putative protein containing a TIR (Toll-Interleukin 1-resistance) domain protein [Actinokineospora sp. UTMC 2448]